LARRRAEINGFLLIFRRDRVQQLIQIVRFFPNRFDYDPPYLPAHKIDS